MEYDINMNHENEEDLVKDKTEERLKQIRQEYDY